MDSPTSTSVGMGESGSHKRPAFFCFDSFFGRLPHFAPARTIYFSVFFNFFSTSYGVSQLCCDYKYLILLNFIFLLKKDHFFLKFWSETSMSELRAFKLSMTASEKPGNVSLWLKGVERRTEGVHMRLDRIGVKALRGECFV